MSDSQMPDTGEPKVVLLVDGSSYLYRAFHAMPDLRAVPGDPSSPATGAIRGMINMLQKLRKDVRADYCACIFDAPGKTFRDDIYPEYKATRNPMPDDLRAQIEPIHEVVHLLGWKVLNVPGVEADDVIGTLACMATERGFDTIISSGDKDLSQLVNEHVTVIDTMNDRKRDIQGVTTEFGVPPELMVDYQTLVGDSVDNVKGVDKVGPKTAVKLLQEFGSLDTLLERADEVKGAVGENLRRAKEWIAAAREARRRVDRRARHRDEFARRDAGRDHRRGVRREARRGGVHPARAQLPGCARAAAARRGVGQAQAVAGGPGKGE